MLPHGDSSLRRTPLVAPSHRVRGASDRSVLGTSEVSSEGTQQQEESTCCSRTRTLSSTEGAAQSALRSPGPSPARGRESFLAGRTPARLEEVSEEIRSAGGVAEAAEVEALDEKAVDEHADPVAPDAGGIDVSFNLITHPSVHGTPLAEMAVEDYPRSVVTAGRTTFLTARAALHHMIRRGSGVIVAFGCCGARFWWAEPSARRVQAGVQSAPLEAASRSDSREMKRSPVEQPERLRH